MNSVPSILFLELEVWLCFLKGVDFMIYTAEGGIKRVVAVRMSPGENVMKGLERVCADHGINNAIILSGMGSLDGCEYLVPIALPDKKAGYGYGDPIKVTDSVSVTGVSGMICHDDDGDPLLHVHINVSDNSGTVRGGHLTENNTVLLTFDVVIGELDDGLEMGRAYDEDLEVFIFRPKQK